jgi:hypothetical protein
MISEVGASPVFSTCAPSAITVSPEVVDPVAMRTAPEAALAFGVKVKVIFHTPSGNCRSVMLENSPAAVLIGASDPSVSPMNDTFVPSSKNTRQVPALPSLTSTVTG